ncbi:hypothetical protein [Paenibacillus sp. An7]|uniref:hypothetical protein n=1 Tax=Paenibacillus sp. An7 TaxID=2689577 RepID=UPI001356B2A4|nr:hypothetical protein [Paenibacillus sp. An7]
MNRLSEYVALFQQGTRTVLSRKEILIDQRNELAKKIAVMQNTLAKLDDNIDGYEEKMLKYQDENLKQ